jgi:hypothetical protein
MSLFEKIKKETQQVVELRDFTLCIFSDTVGWYEYPKFAAVSRPGGACLPTKPNQLDNHVCHTVEATKNRAAKLGQAQSNIKHYKGKRKLERNGASLGDEEISGAEGDAAKTKSKSKAKIGQCRTWHHPLVAAAGSCRPAARHTCSHPHQA